MNTGLHLQNHATKIISRLVLFDVAGFCVFACKANSQGLTLLDFGFAMSLSAQLSRFWCRGSERAVDGSLSCLGKGPACVAGGEPWDRAVCGTLMFMAPEAVEIC